MSEISDDQMEEWVIDSEKKKNERSNLGWSAVNGDLFLRIIWVDSNGEKNIFAEFGVDEMDIPNTIKLVNGMGDRKYYPVTDIFKAATEDIKLYTGWSGIVVMLSALDICVNKRTECYLNKDANYNKVEFGRYSYHLGDKII